MTPQTTDTFHFAGNLLRLRTRTDETNGAFSLVEVKTAPGAGAPPNRHPGEDEAFYIVAGRYQFVMDGEAKTVSAGDYVRIPNGSVHSFRNIGGDVGTMLITIWPGKGHDTFFSEAGEPVPSGTSAFPNSGPPDIPRVKSIAQRCGIEMMLD
jgi:quercetin dioxygenase-like cupin family protein